MKKNEFGGGEKWTILAAKGLIELGHRVTIGAKKNSILFRAAINNVIPVVELNIRSDFSPLTSLKIAGYLKKNKIEIIICNFNKDVRVAGLAAKLAGTPVTLARHGVLLCKKKWKHKVTLKYLTDGIITNTISIKNIYASYGWFKDDFVQVIYNGVEDKSDVVAFDFSKEFPNKKIIFAAGRLTTQKGFNYLIDAAKLLMGNRKDLIFIIAGEGSQRNSLQVQIKNNQLDNAVILLGYVENTDTYLKGADLVVLSSIHEGMPNVIMEAMAVGKAVVATAVNGVPELIKDKETGEIVLPRDSKDLAHTIDRLISDPMRRKEYGKKGLQRVKEYFTIPKMINNLDNYLSQMLNEKNKARF